MTTLLKVTKTQLSTWTRFRKEDPAVFSALSTPAEPTPLTEASSSSARQCSQGAGSVGDPRIDRPHEPAWQTLYSRQRRLSPVHSRGQPGPLAASLPSARIPQPLMAATAAGPSEDDLDPWDMQDAQERLAALATQPVDSSALHPVAADAPVGAATQSSPEISTTEDIAASTLAWCQASLQKQRRGREIYAYHVCTATLESWITPLFASLRSLRLITLSFYPATFWTTTSSTYAAAHPGGEREAREVAHPNRARCSQCRKQDAPLRAYQDHRGRGRQDWRRKNTRHAPQSQSRRGRTCRSTRT